MIVHPIHKLRRALTGGWARLLPRKRRTIRFKRLIARAKAAVRQREDWLLLRERRIAMLESQIARTEARVLERDEWLLLREERIADLETEVDQRGALIRQREARVRSLEILLQGRDSELYLLRTALDQAEDVLRKRDAKLMLLGAQPEQLDPPARIMDGYSEDGSAGAGVPTTIIKEWQQAAAEFASLRLTGGQELIDPYILDRSVHGWPTRLLIATRQAQNWYDRLDLTEGPYLDSLLMVRPGQTVFDCGAHHGVNSIMYSRLVGPSGRVVAFDPFSMNVKIAQLNCFLNNCTNIEFVEAALNSEGGQLHASVAEQCIALERQDADDLVTLKLITLDQFADLRPDFIKIDIEGAEIDALEGAKQILLQKPAFYIEMHPAFLPRFGKDAMDVFQFIKLDEYMCFVNYPGKEGLSPYNCEFELVQPCALFFVPMDKKPMQRYYTTAAALQQ